MILWLIGIGVIFHSLLVLHVFVFSVFRWGICRSNLNYIIMDANVFDWDWVYVQFMIVGSKVSQARIRSAVVQTSVTASVKDQLIMSLGSREGDLLVLSIAEATVKQIHGKNIININ